MSGKSGISEKKQPKDKKSAELFGGSGEMAYICTQ